MCLKVDEMLTRSFSNGRLNGHGYFEQRAPAMKQLTIQVSELHAGGNGELWLTCMSTIPGYVSPNERYADERRHSVRSKLPHSWHSGHNPPPKLCAIIKQSRN